jgi:hypothetical protein
MAFIFTPERDPRRDNVAEFIAGAKVRYTGMADPAEVLSGPHKTTGTRQRYLIRKADGNVSLVPVTDLERIVPRLDQVAGTMAMNLFGLPFTSLTYADRIKVARAATNALRIADSTHGQA